MPGHVLLTYRELVGERLDRGVAVRGQVFDDPNAKGLPENAQALSDRLDQRLGNRLGLRPTTAARAGSRRQGDLPHGQLPLP